MIFGSSAIFFYQDPLLSAPFSQRVWLFRNVLEQLIRNGKACQYKTFCKIVVTIKKKIKPKSKDVFLHYSAECLHCLFNPIAVFELPAANEPTTIGCL